MKLKAIGEPLPIVIELEHGEETLVFHFPPSDNLDQMALASKTGLDEQVGYALRLINRVEGVEDVDGKELKGDRIFEVLNDGRHFPSAFAIQIATAYFTEIARQTESQDDTKKKKKPRK